MHLEEADGMTEAQKETLKFYTTNDYLLINGLLWGEDAKKIDAFIHLINQDGLGVMQEAVEMGCDIRWNCSKEEGERLYQIYQKRFPVINSEEVKRQILARAREDISNMMACLEPLASEMILYRNIKTEFVAQLEQGASLEYRGFSSCSLAPHAVENAMYGAKGCTLVEIIAPAGTPVIRLDLMPDVQNEKDEVILAPMEFLVTKVDKESNRMCMTCKAAL